MILCLCSRASRGVVPSVMRGRWMSRCVGVTAASGVRSVGMSRPKTKPTNGIRFLTLFVCLEGGVIHESPLQRRRGISR